MQAWMAFSGVFQILSPSEIIDRALVNVII